MNKNIIIVLDDGETYSTAGTIFEVSDETMELLEDGVKFYNIEDELNSDQWGRVIQTIG